MKEALKLALESLENSLDLVREDAYNAEKLYGNYPSRQGKVRGLKVFADDHEKAITAVEQALAAPVQEPVAQYSDIVSDGGLDPRNKFDIPPAAQRQWVGLSDDETGYIILHNSPSFFDAAAAIEAKLKEKNT